MTIAANFGDGWVYTADGVPRGPFDGSIPNQRFYRISTTDWGWMTLPSAGVDVDGVSCSGGPGGSIPYGCGKPACPGVPFWVEVATASTIVAGDNLVTDAAGKAVKAGAGVVVARALSADVAITIGGSSVRLVSAVFSSGR